MNLLLLLLACPPPEPQPMDSSGGDDSGPPAGNPTCDALGLPVRPFDATVPSALQRHQPAGDFSVPLRDGSVWTLSENWTGCESYIFLPHWFSVDDLDDTSWWTTGVDELIARSPRNVHYFFVTAGSRDRDAEAITQALEADIQAAFTGLSADDLAWWESRIHVVQGMSAEVGGLVTDMFRADIGALGWAVDREQKLRTLGYFPAVGAYDSALARQDLWPWEMRLYSAAYEPEYFNFEVERRARMDAETVTAVPVFDGSVVQMCVEGPLNLPDAAEMATYDTLEIEVRMECPDKDKMEINNCGAWDYIANYWVDDGTGTWLEISRFITTYHRESHWLVDGSHALAWLKDGGTRNSRYCWAPEWNQQPTGVTLNARLSNRGKGARPQEIVNLFAGGAFVSTYNDRESTEVQIPAGAKKVELVAIITGHGMDTSTNCAEFCDHEHHFTVNGTTHSYELSEPGIEDGCAQSVGTGTVPNQAGTWWFGRGGWCPGREVAPFVVDITNDVSAGQSATISYRGTLEGGEPVDGSGNIEMRSWLVVSY